MTEPQGASAPRTQTRPLDPPAGSSWAGPPARTSAPEAQPQPPAEAQPQPHATLPPEREASRETGAPQETTTVPLEKLASPGEEPQAGEPQRSVAPDAAPRSAPRPAAARAPGPRVPRPASSSSAGKQRRARLRLSRIDPWSVFVLSLLVSVFLAVVLVVAVVALFLVLQAAGVTDSVNQLVGEVSRAPGEAEGTPILTLGRALTASVVVAAVDVVLLTALATLGAVLYNLCASFTGGLEVTLAED